MKTVPEAVAYYLPKKLNGEITMSEIRSELSRFSEEEIQEICREISDAEFDNMKKEKRPLFAFMNHISFSYILVFGNLGIIIFCCFYLYNIYAQEPEYSLQIAPYLFIAGAVTLMGKHWIRIKKYKQAKGRAKE